MFSEINIGGIAVYGTDLVVDPEDKEYAHFLSIAGYQSAVKGLLANFVENRVLTAKIDDNVHWVRRCPGSYLIKSKKMPSGYCHGMAISKMALPNLNEEEQHNQFLLLSGDTGRIISLFYRFMEIKAEIPMHPSWAAWLWRLYLDRSWLIKLETLIGAYQGYLVETSFNAVQEEIADAIRSKDPEIINCMKPQFDNMEKTDG